mmetsp:Transcript_4478/g.9191  ORF Transcript_4478/g.9191 Transcript_4478/m.9191 type:complete len:156 (+) Transcript_4478:1835-2302(+)
MFSVVVVILRLLLYHTSIHIYSLFFSLRPPHFSSPASPSCSSLFHLFKFILLCFTLISNAHANKSANTSPSILSCLYFHHFRAGHSESHFYPPSSPSTFHHRLLIIFIALRLAIATHHNKYASSPLTYLLLIQSRRWRRDGMLAWTVHKREKLPI